MVTLVINYQITTAMIARYVILKAHVVMILQKVAQMISLTVMVMVQNVFLDHTTATVLQNTVMQVGVLTAQMEQMKI